MARDWQLQKAGQKGVPASRSGAGRAVLSSATMQLWQPYVYVTIFLVALVALSCSQNTPLFPVACELNVLIVLDRSDSVKGGFNKSRKFVTDVSEELQIGPHKHRALEVGIQLLNQRNTSIPTLVLVVTDGRSADDPKGPGQEIQRMSNTWVFAAATGDPEKVDKFVLFPNYVFTDITEQKTIKGKLRKAH
ncbi:hypothetical protein TELCIR_11675 [Teladorsagia circumcincta]|uniref:VWFA domain-containing protein n=1 Tax=Teladorsagia circumcincta TaxID=45464 RepID=A0A2G9U8K7_TELCI|nr:hypothetical protein TELCIR_11675 [Teladorsagia circumcincta]